MKKINATFSIPEEMHKRLQSVIGQRKMSNFVVQAIDEALAKKAASLRSAYEAAEKDPARQEVLNDWKVFDGEGWE